MESGIYGWRNKLNGKWYIGQSIDLLGRKSDYENMQFSGQKLFYAAVLRHGLDAFEYIKIMEVCPSRVALNFWETHWIRQLNSFAPNGYNLTTGGYSTEFSEEVIDKLTAKTTELWKTDEYRNKTLAACRTEEKREKNHVGARKQWADPVIRAKSISRMKELRSRPEVRDECRRRALLRHNTLYKYFFIEA